VTTLAEYQTALAEAETALQNLVFGKMTVEVTFPTGQSIRYTPAKISDLKEYIAYLRAAIEGLGGTVAKAPNRRPVRFGF
jgi:hypothetical protein